MRSMTSLLMAILLVVSKIELVEENEDIAAAANDESI